MKSGRSKVAVLRVRPKSVLQDIERACNLAELATSFDAAAPCVLQDSVSSHHPFPSANTTPWQLEGAILALRRLGVTELSCAQGRSGLSDALAREDLNHFGAILKKHLVPALSLRKRGEVRWQEYRPKVRLHVLHELFPDGIYLADHFFGQTVVQLPTLRADLETGLHGASAAMLSGLLGPRVTIPGSRLARARVDALAIQLEIGAGRFAILDATTASRGGSRHPLASIAKGCVLASSDPVALDSVAAKLLGYDPLKIEYLSLAQQDGLGVADPAQIELIGDAVPAEDAMPDAGPARRRVRDWIDAQTQRREHLAPLRAWITSSRTGELLAACGDVYYDYYRWNKTDRALFERWKTESEWGQLFAAYERGESELVLDAPLLGEESAATTQRASAPPLQT